MCNGYDARERGGGSVGMRRAISYGHELDQEHFREIGTCSLQTICCSICW